MHHAKVAAVIRVMLVRQAAISLLSLDQPERCWWFVMFIAAVVVNVVNIE
ncbi:MAG: hypothetical protein WCA22_19315 [Candidatus Binatus sp.]